MKTLFSVTFLLISAALFAAQGNLLRQGDFDNLTDASLKSKNGPWLIWPDKGVNGSISYGEGVGKTRGLLIEVSGEPTNLILFQNVDVPSDMQKTGGEMTFSYLIRPEGVSGEWGAGFGATIILEDGKMQPLEKKKSHFLLRTSPWTLERHDFYVPPKSKIVRVSLGMANAAGRASFDNADLRASGPEESILLDASSFTAEIGSRGLRDEIPAGVFGANCPFHFKGLYEGTLPADNPLSRRKEFAEAIHACGIQLLRFPGGNPVQYYLYENKKATDDLTRKIAAAHLKRTGKERRGEYDPGGLFSFDYYVPLENFLGFCKDSGLEPILQLNTFFYLDPRDGGAHAITHNHFELGSDLYQGDRIAEACESLKRQLAWIQAKGFQVKFFEIGNEEYAHMDMADYLKLAEAYSGIIKKVSPRSRILITGDRWIKDGLSKIKEEGFLDRVDAVTKHYPYARWHSPKTKEDNANLRRFVWGNVSIDQNLDTSRELLDSEGFQKISLAVTESSVYRYESWSAHAVNRTTAQALLYAYNWLDYLASPAEIAVFHDIESTYFGMMKYDVFYDAAEMKFKWIDPKTPGKPEAVPEDRFFQRRYFVGQTGLVNKMLSANIGWQAVETRLWPGEEAGAEIFKTVKGFSAQKDSLLMMTFVNRSSQARSARIALSDQKGFKWISAKGRAGTKLDGVFEADFPEISLRPESQDSKGIRFILPGFSVIQILLEKDAR